MAAFSSHAGIELESIGPSQRPPHLKTPASAQTAASRRSASIRRASSRKLDESFPPQAHSPPPTETPLHVQPTWNESKLTMARVVILCYEFLVIGVNDGSYGALLASLESYYNLSYTVVSLVFLTPFVGYTVAALISSPMTVWGGQRAIAFFSPVFRLISIIVMLCHPPYPVAVAFLVVSGLGIGLSDAAWNAWFGDFKSSNQLLGFLHASYGLGATIAPLIVTSMLETYKLPWWDFYYVMLVLTSINMVCGLSLFWGESGKEFRRKNVSAEGDDKGRTRQSLRNKVTWICAGFFLFYVGSEVSLGGWIITFMTQVRHGGAYEAGFTATGFWLGLTIGRIIGGFATPKIGERLSVIIYLGLILGLQLIFWLVPSFIVSAVVVALQGFFLGPLFPAGIVAETKILPKKLHTSSVGISAAVGGAGAALLPFITGAIANSKGVSTLQPIILVFLACCLGFWLMLPKIPSNNHEE